MLPHACSPNHFIYFTNVATQLFKPSVQFSCYLVNLNWAFHDSFQLQENLKTAPICHLFTFRKDIFSISLSPRQFPFTFCRAMWKIFKTKRKKRFDKFAALTFFKSQSAFSSSAWNISNDWDHQTDLQSYMMVTKVMMMKIVTMIAMVTMVTMMRMVLSTCKEERSLNLSLNFPTELTIFLRAPWKKWRWFHLTSVYRKISIDTKGGFWNRFWNPPFISFWVKTKLATFFVGENIWQRLNHFWINWAEMIIHLCHSHLLKLLLAEV